MAEPFADATEHLLAELGRLDLLLWRQVLRLRASHMLTEDEFRGLYISDRQVDVLLQAGGKSDGDTAAPDAQILTAQATQRDAENRLRVLASRDEGRNLPLVRLTERYELSRFELDILLLAIASEVDLHYETLYAYAQNDITKKRPTVELALKIGCESVRTRLAARAVFAETGTLLSRHLIRLVADPHDHEPPLPAHYLAVDARVVDYVLGREALDARLAPFVAVTRPEKGLDDLMLPSALVARLKRAQERNGQGHALWFLNGPPGIGKSAVAGALCAQSGLAFLNVDLDAARAGGLALDLLLALVRREAELSGAGIYFGGLESLVTDETRRSPALAAFQRTFVGSPYPVVLGSTMPLAPDDQDRGEWLSFEFPVPSGGVREQLWQGALEQGNGHRVLPSLDLSALADQFQLTPAQIARAARAAQRAADLEDDSSRAVNADELFAAARAQSNTGLRQLAVKIEPFYTWSDIILPSRAMEALRQVHASVKYRRVVYGHWGFDRRIAGGKGLMVLFAGASGTGKTMAAQILARELGLDLYRIDLAAVVSKYIGETEKNLDRLFDEAQTGNAILFFDEADALFGKRSGVKDAHDRYANIEVAYLLQKMEEFEGIVILATNLQQNLDEAFARRIQHRVDFPFPDAKDRERIWRGLFPPAAPRADDIDLPFLARQFEFSGGNIRNVVVAAAFLAAEQGVSIGMEHLIQATANELRKLGRLPSRAELGSYYEWIRARD